MIPVFDLHCDLLYSLTDDFSRIADKTIPCALPLLEAGGLKIQVCAIFEQMIPGCKQSILSQLKAFDQLRSLQQHKIKFLLAFENIGAYVEDELNLQAIEALLDKNSDHVAYVALTWKEENHLGGGNLTRVGLKEAGKKVIECLANRKIPLDMSHMSDFLAYDVLNYLENKGLEIPIVASHSNFREVIPHSRNLSKEFAKEIIRRKGLIGLNFVKGICGEASFDDIWSLIVYANKLGAESSLALGADFFEARLMGMGAEQPFFSEALPNAACYQLLAEHLLTKGIPKDLLAAIFFGNAYKFYEEHKRDICNKV